MDLSLIKVLDALLTEGSEETTRIYLPTIVKRSDIETISPNITQKGKLYKNMSVVKTYNGDSYIVMGNYKDLNSKIENKYISKNIGFK